LNAGDKFFFRKQSTALVAGIMGNGKISESQFKIVGAHTDSPGLRIKFNGFQEKAGYRQLGVEVYGGPILATWLDRELALAGRIVVQQENQLKSLLWKSDEPWTIIPNAAIHLNRDVNSEGLKLKNQENLPPIIGLADPEKPFSKALLFEKIAAHLNLKAEEIVGWELELYDLQKGSLTGLNQEFIVSGRIDNLAMCHAALSALTKSATDSQDHRLIFLFDNEEVGSNTLNGGGSPLLVNTLERLIYAQGGSRADLLPALSRSFNISADGAHAIHPNYLDKYEPNHHVKLNGGPVIKINAQQRYASSAESAARFRLIAEKAGVPLQNYIHHSNLPSGSTIGPISSTISGIATVDVGNAMLSMHSIRETAGALDHYLMIQALHQFFSE
jgi:aspartyl aminopeptidase